MKKTHVFGSCEQALLFDVFGEYSEGDELEILATNISKLSQKEIEALRQAIREVLKTIPYKPREVLKLRYGIDTEMLPLSREKIGELFNFSGVRARQHELKARRMCRHPTRIRLLKQFVSKEIQRQWES